MNSKLLKYISLGTATLMLSSWMQAGNCMSMGKKDLPPCPEILPWGPEDEAQANTVQQDIKTAFEGLKATSDDWEKNAESFIDIFNKLNNFLNEVADKRGAKPAVDSFIDPSLWKANLLAPQEGTLFLENYLKEEIMGYVRAKLGDDFYMCGDLGSELEKQFKKIKGPLTNAIKISLGVKSLHEAGAYWEKNFINPVGQLLIDHSQEMVECDSETLQLLLQLYSCYRVCETIPCKIPAWKNIKEVNEKFYSSLVDTMFACKDNEQKKDILKSIFNEIDNVTLKFLYKNYICGKFKYNLQIEDLVRKMKGKRSGKGELATEIEDAFNSAIQEVESYREEYIKAKVQF